MKYFLFIFFLFGTTACFFSGPTKEIPSENIFSEIELEWTIISDSGASLYSESGSVSETGIVFEEDSVILPTELSTQEIGDFEKDTELQNIMDDIDNLFSDIEKGGK